MLKNFNLLSYFETKPETVESEDKPESSDEKSTSQTESQAYTKAMEWGNYLLQVGKSATDKATNKTLETAKKLKENVVEVNITDQNNILDKFSEEQSKFKAEKRSKEIIMKEMSRPWIELLKSDSESSVLLREKIFHVSDDDSNFLRNPPPGSNFKFDLVGHTEVMMLLLKEDKQLNAKRFKLVPRKIKEDVFWKNYFYRITLIKQSLLTDGEKDDEDKELADNGDEAKHNDKFEDAVDFVPDNEDNNKEEIDEKSKTKLDEEIEDDDLEAELQKELSEFELVNDNDKDGSSANNLLNDSDKQDGEYDDIEREIMDELQK